VIFHSVRKFGSSAGHGPTGSRSSYTSPGKHSFNRSACTFFLFDLGQGFRGLIIREPRRRDRDAVERDEEELAGMYAIFGKVC
jgi:hypothetical protein